MRPKIPLLILCFTAFYLADHLSGSVNEFSNGKGVAGFFQNLIHVFLNTSFYVFLLDAILTYLLFFYLYPRKGTIITTLVYLIIAIPLMISLRYLIEEVIIFAITGHHNYGTNARTAKIYIPDNIYFTIYFSLLSIVFFGVQYERFSKLKKQALELQARNAELSFLKSQINPHFLFNNLNSIYTLIYQKSENALPAVSKLSELLRYMLYQKEDLVLLSKEISYLHNFIDLQLMRYDFTPCINIDIEEGIDEGLTITPLTLIPFVENAFKHGDLKTTEYPLSISISVNDNWLYFNIKNKKNNMHKDETGGIGLENVRKRLELLKPNDFELKIIENNNIFDVKLKMTING